MRDHVFLFIAFACLPTKQISFVRVRADDRFLACVLAELCALSTGWCRVPCTDAAAAVAAPAAPADAAAAVWSKQRRFSIAMVGWMQCYKAVLTHVGDIAR